MVGLFGTTVELIKCLEVVSSARATWFGLLGDGAAHALVLTAIGLAVGVLAIWAAAFLEGDPPGSSHPC